MRCVVMALSFGLGNAALFASAQTVEIGVPAALARIEANERRWNDTLQCAQWSALLREGKLAALDCPEDAEFTPAFHRSRVLFEPSTGRYRVEMDSVMRWIQGKAPFVAQRQAWSSDGIELRDLKFERPGTELPNLLPKNDEPKGRGRVYLADDARFTNSFSPFRPATGMAFMPPQFFGQTLSARIRAIRAARRTVAVSEKEKIWTLRLPELDGNSTIVVQYDPSLGLVREASWWNGEPARPWRRYTVNYQDIRGSGPSAVRLPATVRIVSLFDKLIEQLDYSDMKIAVKTDASSFKLVFVPGVIVTDEVEGVEFTADPADPR